MSKSDLFFSKSLLNAAGTLGFSPDPKSPVEPAQLGAFVTNPVSWAPRTPAKGDRYIPFPGGFLLHTGYPNPGLKSIIRQHARRWAHCPVPVIVHLLAQEPETVRRMVEQLEGVEGVMGVEVGLPPDMDLKALTDLALAAVGELASIIRLPFEIAADAFHHITDLEAILHTGVSAISLAPPRGTLPGSGGSLVSGRLYGPGLFPQAAAVVMKMAAVGIPTIGAGGIYRREQADRLLSIGAIAVQLDGVLWRGGFQF